MSQVSVGGRTSTVAPSSLVPRILVEGAVSGITTVAAIPASGAGQAPAMVAGGVADDASRLRAIAERSDCVGGAAKLEGTRVLQGFCFDPEGSAASRVSGHVQDWRA